MTPWPTIRPPRSRQQPIPAIRSASSGLILAIIPCTTTIGLVLSIVAYIISRRAGFQNGKALAGIIVGAAYIVVGLILQLTMGLLTGIFHMTGN
jgi:hypothetical protein